MQGTMSFDLLLGRAKHCRFLVPLRSVGWGSGSRTAWGGHGSNWRRTVELHHCLCYENVLLHTGVLTQLL